MGRVPLGEGVLCKVWRYSEEPPAAMTLVKIVRYDNKMGWYWDESSDFWQHAEPATLAEIKEYLIS